MSKKYQIIYADPPWEYRNKKTGGSMKSGSASKYKTLSLDKICSLDIKSISHNNSVLFLWTTTPFLQGAFSVMNAWGFKYKTALYWRKIMSLGMGFWFRGQVEVLLMGVKGKVKAFRIQKTNFIQAKAQKHSQKPEEFRKLIEETKLMPRIELFAREPHEGWDVWGNEVDSDIELEDWT